MFGIYEVQVYHIVGKYQGFQFLEFFTYEIHENLNSMKININTVHICNIIKKYEPTIIIEP